MSGKRSDLDAFFTRPVSLTLERVLVMDYLLAQGFLPCDLQDLPPEQVAALLAEARRFAIRKLADVEPPVMFSAYVPVGFSLN